LVGANRAIGVELDPHRRLTLKRGRLADIIDLYKVFPHTDAVDRAEGSALVRAPRAAKFARSCGSTISGRSAVIPRRR
jgi:microcystin degradation protein MlrC